MAKAGTPSKQEIRKQLESQMDSMVDNIYKNMSSTQVSVKDQGQLATNQQTNFDVQLSYCQKCGCCGAAENEKKHDQQAEGFQQTETVFDQKDQGKQILDYFQM